MKSDALVREEVLYERLDDSRFSWGATFAGAVITTAAIFLLLALGAGFGCLCSPRPMQRPFWPIAF
jgi:hypothetical protein